MVLPHTYVRTDGVVPLTPSDKPVVVRRNMYTHIPPVPSPPCVVPAALCLRRGGWWCGALYVHHPPTRYWGDEGWCVRCCCSSHHPVLLRNMVCGPLLIYGVLPLSRPPVYRSVPLPRPLHVLLRMPPPLLRATWWVVNTPTRTPRTPLLCTATGTLRSPIIYRARARDVLWRTEALQKVPPHSPRYRCRSPYFGLFSLNETLNGPLLGPLCVSIRALRCCLGEEGIYVYTYSPLILEQQVYI